MSGAAGVAFPSPQWVALQPKQAEWTLMQLPLIQFSLKRISTVGPKTWAVGWGWGWVVMSDQTNSCITIWTKTPINSDKNTAKTRPLVYKRWNEIVKFDYELLYLKVDYREWSCGHFDAKTDFIVAIVFKKTWFLWTNSALYKILVTKIQCVRSHCFVSFHETIDTGTYRHVLGV